MIEATRSPLRVESLKAKHLSMLASTHANKHLQWLRSSLIQTWFAQVERYLPKLLPSRNAFSLLALEDNDPIAVVILQPCNLRGSCWLLSFPDLLLEPKGSTLNEVNQVLLNNALQFGSERAQSWLIKCSVNDSNQIAIARESGFQPLKLLNCWTQPTNTNSLVI